MYMPTKLLDLVHRRVATATTSVETTLTAVGGDPAGPRDASNLPSPMLALVDVASADAQYGRITGPQVDPNGIYVPGRTLTALEPISSWVGEQLEDLSDLVLAGFQDAGADQDIDGNTTIAYEAEDGPEVPSLGEAGVGVVGIRATLGASVADTWVVTGADTAFPTSIIRKDAEYWIVACSIYSASLTGARLGIRSHSNGTKAPLPWGSDVAQSARRHPVAPWVDQRVERMISGVPQPYYFSGGNRPTVEHFAIAGTAQPVMLARLVYRNKRA